jgi:dipeptidyl aminopeptidase/acylaminoacyl peptidase
MAAAALIRRLVVIAAALASCAAALAHQDDSPKSNDVSDAQLSPDGSSVLFARLGAIWRIPFSGGDPQRVTGVESASGGHPRWSPDGRDIGFLRAGTPGAPAQIFVMAAGAQAARAVTPASISVVAFEWSPSGRRLAFVTGGITKPGLWVVNANGSEQRMLRDGATAAFAWAPDDSAVARIAGDAAAMPLPVEIVPADGTAPPRQIATDAVPRITWSRDGTIALIGRRSAVASRLLLASAPDFALREIPLPGTPNLTDVVAMGDGQISLTFRSRQESLIEHLTIATGARLTVLPPGIAEIVTTPSWSLDGTRYVVAGRSASRIAEVFAGAIPLPESGRPDVVGARPPPVRQITFADR